MNKLVFGAVAGLLLGGIAGSLIAQHSLRQRQQGLAVMWLLQHHVQVLANAAAKPDCQGAGAALQRLSWLGGELTTLYPQAYAQDQVLRQHVEQVRSAVAAASAAQCSALSPLVAQLRDACDQCHRDYR